MRKQSSKQVKARERWEKIRAIAQAATAVASLETGGPIEWTDWENATEDQRAMAYAAVYQIAVRLEDGHAETWGKTFTQVAAALLDLLCTEEDL